MTPIDFEKIRKTLKRWIQESTGLQSAFQEEPRPFIDSSKGAIALLNILAIRSLGEDENRQSHDEDNDEILQVHSGNRTMVVSVQVESYSQEPNESARAYLERARIRLKFDSIKLLFCDAGIAVIKAMPLVPLDYEVDERVRSRAGFDVEFAVAAIDTDDPIGYIETVEVESSITREDGSPTSVQIDETITLPD